jgi:hypothetical protein
MQGYHTDSTGEVTLEHAGGAYVPTVLVGVYAPLGTGTSQPCQQTARLRHPRLNPMAGSVVALVRSGRTVFVEGILEHADCGCVAVGGIKHNPLAQWWECLTWQSPRSGKH